MAQALYGQPLTNEPFPDPNLQGASVIELRVIYEPVASAIGVGADRPYVAAYMQTIGGEQVEATGARECEIIAFYTDGSQESLAKTAVGGSGIRGEAIPTAAQWWVMRADGIFWTAAAAPTTATAVAQNAAAASRERLPVNADKDIDFIDFFIGEGSG